MPKCPQTPTRKPKKRLTKSQAKLKAANQRYLQFKQFDEFYTTYGTQRDTRL